MKPCFTCGFEESTEGTAETCVRCLRARVASLERAGRHIADELMGQVNSGVFKHVSHSTRIYLRQLAGVALDPTKLS